MAQHTLLKTILLKTRKGLKIVTPKQIIQRLPISLAEMKAGNNWKSLLNKIKQIVYSLYQLKEITKKVYSNVIKSIQIQMGTILMNSENSKTSHPHRLLLNLTDEIHLRRSEKKKYCIYYTWKNIKSLYKNSKFKISAPT